MRRILAIGFWSLASCGGSSGDTGAPLGPDITGRYNVIIGGSTGCNDDPTWVSDWASGPLQISGSPESLVFDFGDNMTFDGRVGADWKYQFYGTVEYNGATLDLSHFGEASQSGDGSWDLEGDFTVTVNDDQFSSNDCTLDAPMKATALTRR